MSVLRGRSGPINAFNALIIQVRDHFTICLRALDFASDE
jgi:hypothetical protein